MLYFDGIGGLILAGLWIGCFIDVVLTPETACRNLPKLAWVFIVLLFSFVGSIAWLVAGRPWDRTGVPSNSNQRNRGAASRFPEYDRPNRSPATNPDDDEEFLASLRKRAEEQRRRAREQPGEGRGDGGDHA
ncbi:MAG TPA: PLD nuclease N-terminal domain-containing protein [Jatrophihabitantaceae bacterium]|jgi:hypothetical protein|nr:PLD nuclease N-terminal domain-containing protein [Jatrophihabitantaceae bacterium]